MKIERIYLMSCPDKSGIVATITQMLFQNSANILSLEQHIEDDNSFFMRIHTEFEDSHLSAINHYLDGFRSQYQAQLLEKDPQIPMRLAILVSKESACLYELLLKQQSGELPANVVSIISNHRDLEGVAEHFNIPYVYLPIDGDKQSQEKKVIERLKKDEVDCVALARYMQILSPDFVTAFENRTINIHHGFLPAFKGARPYHQAFERGVKIVGATAHYVSEVLDDGPIIAQDVIRVSHSNKTREMIEMGRDVERRVLSKAVKAHLEHRILRWKRRTIVFEA